MSNEIANTGSVTSPPIPLRDWTVLACLTGGILTLSYLSSFPMMDAQIMQWYASLSKSPLNPPPWAFSVVWPLLYIGMSVAAWRVWRTPHAKPALRLFALQLAANLLWTIMFFAMQSPALGMGWLLLILLLAIATCWKFYLHDRIAGLLMLPYIWWLCFAAYLNGSILLLNGA